MSRGRVGHDIDVYNSNNRLGFNYMYGRTSISRSTHKGAGRLDAPEGWSRTIARDIEPANTFQVFFMVSSNVLAMWEMAEAIAIEQPAGGIAASIEDPFEMSSNSSDVSVDMPPSRSPAFRWPSPDPRPRPPPIQTGAMLPPASSIPWTPTPVSSIISWTPTPVSSIPWTPTPIQSIEAVSIPPVVTRTPTPFIAQTPTRLVSTPLSSTPTSSQYVTQEMADRRESEPVTLDRIRQRFEEWRGKCGICKAQGSPGEGHRWMNCPEATANMKKHMQKCVDEFQEGKIRFNRHASCSKCRMPQGICRRYNESSPRSGEYRTAGGGKCQFDKGLIFEAAAALIASSRWQARQPMDEWIERAIEEQKEGWFNLPYVDREKDKFGEQQVIGTVRPIQKGSKVRESVMSRFVYIWG